MARTYPKADSDFELVPEGWRRVTVRKCTEKQARSGDAYYNLELEDEATRRVLWDIVMLEGKGQPIGQSKLLALGGAEDLGDEVSVLEPHEIEGIQAMAYVSHEEFDGKTSSKVNIRHGDAGYMPPEWSPAGSGAGGGRQDVPPVDDDLDVPF